MKRGDRVKVLWPDDTTTEEILCEDKDGLYIAVITRFCGPIQLNFRLEELTVELLEKGETL